MKTPPGFSASTPVAQDRYPANLDENELLLSKVLDDDDDKKAEDNKLSLPISMSYLWILQLRLSFLPTSRLEPRSCIAFGDHLLLIGLSPLSDNWDAFVMHSGDGMAF